MVQHFTFCLQSHFAQGHFKDWRIFRKCQIKHISQKGNKRNKTNPSRGKNGNILQ